MNYEFFVTSKSAWKSMFETISNAKNSIYLEMYIFENDLKEFDFVEVLKTKARQQLKVKVILDSFGSIGLDNKQISELRQAGVEVLLLSYLLHRTHRKLLIVDDSIAFIGGVNLHQKASLWNDLMLKLKGQIVKNLLRSFVKSYINAKGSDTEFINEKNKQGISRNLKAWVVDHTPIKRKFYLKKLYKENLNSAKDKIVFVTPYFMLNRWLQASLHQALLRGVRVEILVPKNTDSYIIDRVNYFYIYKLSRLGVIFYMESKMNHAKAMVIDDDKCMVGSQNLDLLSLNLNSEIGVFFKDKNITSKLLDIIGRWKDNSSIFNHDTYKPKWFDYIISPIIKLFSKIFRF